MLCRSLLMTLSSSLVACVPTQEQKAVELEGPSFTNVLVAPPPLRIAYTYDATVDEERLSIKNNSNRDEVRFRPGRMTTRAAFDRVFRAAFRDTDASLALPPVPSGFDGAIVVRISHVSDSFGVTEPLPFVSEPGTVNEEGATIGYARTFLDTDGREVEVWKVI